MPAVVYNILAVVNTVDTMLGLIFLATSYVVWRKRDR